MLRLIKEERFSPSRKKVMLTPPRQMNKGMAHRRMLQTIRGGHRHMIGRRRGMK